MTYARNWTPNKGTNSSYGVNSFQAPQRRVETTPRRIGRIARTIGRQAVNVAVRNRYRLATNLAGKVGRYYFENQLDYVSRTSWGEAYRFLTEEQPWAKQGRDVEAGWKYPDGYICASSRDMGNPAPGCGNMVAGTRAANTNNCSNYHLIFQAYTPIQPHHNLIFMGPTSAAGCARMNNATVVKYAQNTVLNPNDFYYQETTVKAPVMPMAQPLRQTPRHGRTRQPMPMVNSAPMPQAMPLPRFRRGRLRLRPYQTMARQFSPQPLRYGGRGSGITTVAHNQLPPNKRDSEAKFKINLGLAGKLYGGFTEFQDFTESVAKAVKLPNDRDCRSRNPYKAWACIIANRDKLDRNAAAYNIIENQIEDFLIGQFGRAGAKAVAKAAAAGYYRSPVGLQFGGSYHRQTLAIGEIKEIK